MNEQTTDDPMTIEFLSRLATLMEEYGAEIFSDAEGCIYIEVGAIALWVDHIDHEKLRKVASGEKWCVPLRRDV